MQSVNDKSVLTKLIDTRVFSTVGVCLQMVKLCGKRRVGGSPFSDEMVEMALLWAWSQYTLNLYY